MRLSLKDYVFSDNTSPGQVKHSYANYRYNNLFLSTNYFKSNTFLELKDKNIFKGLTKPYFNRNNKNVIVRVESNYFLSQNNDDGIITLNFRNVNEEGQTVNTYSIELIFNIYKNTFEEKIVALEWINITSDKPNRSIKYEVDLGELGKFTDLTEYDLVEEISYQNEEAYIKYPKNYSYDAHYDNNIPKVSFENNIFPYKSGEYNQRFYRINNNDPALTIKAIGALATDTIKIYFTDIVDIKKNYRQGCLFDTDSFKGVKKLSKKLYLGTNEVPEDEIANSEKVDTGHVRLFKDSNYKQAKYIESDNV